MIDINPYNTSTGKYIDIRKLEEDLINYFIRGPKGLSYEVSFVKDVNVVFITGRQDYQEEQELPIFLQPIVSEGTRGTPIIFCDVRPYVNANKDFISLQEIVTDGASLSMALAKVIMLAITIKDNGELENLADYLVKGFSAWIVGNLKMALSLSYIEEVRLGYVLIHYYASLIFNRGLDTGDETDLPLYSVLKNGVGAKQSRGTVIKMIEGLNNNPKNVDDLINNIREGVGGSKVKGLTKDVLFSLVSGNSYGHGSALGLMMCIESPSMWLGTMYVNMENGTFKRSRLATILEQNKKFIDNKEFIKRAGLTINSKILR